jgi:carnitine 3-dehydrogenase
MIDAGEATVEEIDIAVSNGPGLRWAIMGPLMIQHLAGGEGGIVHSLDGYLKLALKEPRTRLRPPEISDELREALVAGCTREAAGRSVAEIARERDTCLVAILKALESCRSGGEGGS